MRRHRHLDQVGPLIHTRARLLPFTAALLVAAAGSARAQDSGSVARSKGAAHAPVTVYEMADFQCPACRHFTLDVLPALDSEYVQTGKVRWVFINLPLTSIHPNAMAAAEVAMCVSRQGARRFWSFHDSVYRHQDDWATLAQPRDTLLALARRSGANRRQLLSCLADSTARKDVELDARRAAQSGAHATPSFYIEGGLLEGAPPTPDPMRHILDSIYAVRTHPQ